MNVRPAPWALIGAGGNLGTAGELTARFMDAERLLRARLGPGIVVRWSPGYFSEPEGPVRDQPRFMNAVLALVTDSDGRPGASVTPQALLALLLDIERTLGRDRARQRAQGPRPIDLDLLFVGDARMDSPGPPALRLPHPRIATRAFVLRPLADLMGEDWLMPGFARTVGDCLGAPDLAAARRALVPVEEWPLSRSARRSRSR